MDNRNIFLIGMMGAGKSTVGKLLANKFGMSFIDTDREIEKDAGMSISRIFSVKGESYFRSLESAYLNEIINSHTQHVISCGGGFPLNPGALMQMKQVGVVVYLNCEPKLAYSRIKNQNNRPLKDSDGVFIERYNLRKETYENADVICDANGSIEHVLMTLSNSLTQFNF